MKELNEDILSALILCDPITHKGKDAMSKLDLTERISPEFFFEKLRVKSKYETKYFFENDDDSECGIENKIKQQEIQHSKIKESYGKFIERFISDEPNTCPMLLLGVAGNGKSIEVNNQLWQISKEHECDNRYIDLEEINTRPTFNGHFDCPDPFDPVWLFCTKLLEEIMWFILENKQKSDEIARKYYEIFASINLGEKEHNKLFSAIKLLKKEGSPEAVRNRVRDVFNALLQFVDKTNDETKRNSVKNLLRVLLFLVHCYSPTNKHYIVFDNIERYVQTNEKNIPIPDGALKEIYDLIRFSFNDLISDLNKRKGMNYGWKAYKAVVVVRRTSLELLAPRDVQTISISKDNIADITGHFQIDDIWKKKTEGSDSVWAMVRDSFLPDKRNSQIFEIAKIVLKHRSEAIGWSYQNMIAPLMSHGIRRNAKAQAHAIMRVYDELASGLPFVINYEQFIHIYESSVNDKNGCIKYMLRRALIEYQFKWAISDEEDQTRLPEQRWSELGIGHLKRDRNDQIVHKTQFTHKTNISNVEIVYYDDNNIAMFRRILSVLSYAPFSISHVGEVKDKTVVEMFSGISLYELIKGVMLDPMQREAANNVVLTEEQLLPFARVLIALSNISNEETKSAPYVILNIKSQEFHDNPNGEVLASLLVKIWAKGEKESRIGEYNSNYYGARITDAGNAFLMKWHASFSFISALYCYGIPPLFFLKDSSRIKFVIETVYNCALSLCEKYEMEAAAFCPPTCNFTDKKYLPRKNNQEVSYKQQIKEMHTNHLKLYRYYVDLYYDKIGWSSNDKKDIIRFINDYIGYYSNRLSFGGTSICF